MVSLRNKPFTSNRSGFSLLELISVIAVMALLLGAGVSLLGDTGSKARRTTVDVLSGMIDQGRSQAITSHSQVLLAIAEPKDLSTSNDERARVTLFKLTDFNKDTGEATGEILRRWEILNSGIALIKGKVGDYRNVIDEREVELTYTAGGRNQRITVHGIVFSARGGRDWPVGSGPVGIRIAEGGYRGEHKTPTPNYRGESRKVIEDCLKVGRVIARAQRFDP